MNLSRNSKLKIRRIRKVLQGQFEAKEAKKINSLLTCPLLKGKLITRMTRDL
jgi:hypothetical protein